MTNARDAKRKHMIDAAQQLLTLPAPGAERPCYYKLVTAGGAAPDLRMRTALAVACGNQSVDFVHLVFGSGPHGDAPRQVVLGISEERAFRWYEDCVLWAPEDEGPLVVVPRGVGVDDHYGFDGSRLERRPGRPAATLGAGMVRAERRVRELAKVSRADERGGWLDIHAVAA